MRKNNEIYPFRRKGARRAFWFLFGTGFLLCSIAFAQEDEFMYDSSIQRSNFLSISPSYENQLEESLKDRRSQFLWKFRFDSQNLQTESNIQSQWAGATFRSKFKYQLLENLRFKSKVNLTMRSGRTQDLFGDLEANSYVNPREAKIEWEPIEDTVILDAGVIHQRFFNQPLFLSNLGFPGLSQQIKYEQKRYVVGIRTQQLIPTSFTQGTRVTEREDVPWFFTESLEATVSTSRSNFVKGRLTHFRYRDLPAVVAFDSFLYGNTVTNADIKNARFIYGFDGFLGQLAYEQKFSDSFAAQMQWDTIKNTVAPDNAGEAQSITLSAANDFGRWIMAARFQDYFIESDAVPGSYNSYFLGHNNRIGNAYELNFESKDWGVMIRARYTDADLLAPTFNQRDGLQQDNQQTFYISVETMYDFI